MWERDPRNASEHGPGNRLEDLIGRRLGRTEQVNKVKHLAQESIHQAEKEAESAVNKASDIVSKHVMPTHTEKSSHEMVLKHQPARLV